MDHLLEKEIIAICPSIYKKHFIDENSSMYSGFCCGNGWGQILKDFTLKIKEICEKYHLTKENYPSVIQIKQKFGDLRIYIEYANMMKAEFISEIYKETDKATELSVITCEICGEPGKIRNGDWIFVTCDKHA